VAAPSSPAVGILKKDDFSKSDTVQRIMLDELLQEAARGQVLWVDEAGFLSARDMRWLVEFASKNDCRLILSGDTRASITALSEVTRFGLWKQMVWSLRLRLQRFSGNRFQPCVPRFKT
jgi:hypothetical protein